MLRTLSKQSHPGFLTKQNACIATVLATLAIAGCEHQNEGSTTTAHLFSAPTSSSASTGQINSSALQNHSELSLRYSIPPQTSSSGISQLNNAQNENGSIEIAKGEGYSVHILSAYICDFHEGWNPFDMSFSNSAATPCHNGSEGPDSSGSPYTRGEIALLMNVFERTGVAGETVNPANQRGAARIVYYNSDVRESGQYLNALNIPVHGPILYAGNPVFMELAILELDNQGNQKTKEMLGALATLGGAAYPPAGKALNILTSISSVFLSGNQDDVEMRYQIEFDRPRREASTTIARRMPFRDGYIAFMRNENRSQDLRFDQADWQICPKEGTIAPAGDGKCEANQIYRNRTWVLVRIAKEDREAANQLEVGQDFASFMQALNATNSEKLDVTEIRKAILRTHSQAIQAEITAMETTGTR
tara:strand:+ start:528 stop:1784 length:1257 start_codon:yes stop_codon:yes gene_type:complete